MRCNLSDFSLSRTGGSFHFKDERGKRVFGHTIIVAVAFNFLVQIGIAPEATFFNKALLLLGNIKKSLRIILKAPLALIHMFPKYMFNNSHNCLV